MNFHLGNSNMMIGNKNSDANIAFFLFFVKVKIIFYVHRMSSAQLVIETEAPEIVMTAVIFLTDCPMVAVADTVLLFPDDVTVILQLPGLKIKLPPLHVLLRCMRRADSFMQLSARLIDCSDCCCPKDKISSPMPKNWTDVAIMSAAAKIMMVVPSSTEPLFFIFFNFFSFFMIFFYYFPSISMDVSKE